MDAGRAQKDLYSDIVRAHARTPRAAGRILNAAARASAHNALCGDRIEWTVDIDAHGVIRALAHATEGCLLCTASASLLATHATGLDRASARALCMAMRSLLVDETPPGLPEDLLALAAVIGFPSRRGCVLLPWTTFLDAVGSDRAAWDTKH